MGELFHNEQVDEKVDETPVAEVQDTKEDAKTEEVKEEVKEEAEKAEVPAVMFGEIDATGIAQKYDSYNAYFSGGKTVAEVMKDGQDGFPPAFYEVTDAFMVALKNNLLSKDTKAAKALGKEYINLILKLDDLTNVTKSLDGSDEFLVKLLGEAQKSESEEDSKSKDTDVETAEKTEEVEVKTETAEDNTANIIADAISKALAPVVDKLTKANEENEETKSELKKLKEDVSKSEERVKELEETTQTRKSGSELEDAEKTAKSIWDYEQEEKAAKRLLNQVSFR